MAQETFIVTPIPRAGTGAATPGQRVTLGVHLSVRLTPDQEGQPFTAEAFPACFSLRGGAPSFTVSIDGAPAVPATTSAGVDAALWASLLCGLPVNSLDPLALAGEAATRIANAKPKYSWPIWREITLVMGGLLTNTLGDPQAVDLSASLAACAPAPRHLFPAPRSFAGPVDVHDRIAHLQTFPQAMRGLGLVWDLQFTWPPSRLGPVGDRYSIAVAMTLPGGPSRRVTVVSPTVTAARRPDPGDGFEPGSSIQLVPVDVSHGARQLLSWQTAGQPPALLSSGIGIVRSTPGGQSAYLTARVQQRVTVESALAANLALPALADDDLLLGHRVDVADVADGVWRSLCGRSYTLSQIAADGTATPITGARQDEGLIASGLAGTDQQTWITDVLARWSGWSLAAPRPGTEQSLGAGLGAQTIAPPGTLPALRYGHTYAVRLRRVLLDGSSPPAGAGSPGGEASQLFARSEPVPPPALAPADPVLQPGASAARLVVRTGATGRVTVSDQRWLFPPKVAIDVAERHGVFDTSAAVPDPHAYTDLIARYEGSLWSGPRPTGPNPAKADVVAATAWGTGAAPAAPYLPDPMATACVLRVVSGGEAIGAGDGSQLAAPFPLDVRSPGTVSAIALRLEAAAGAMGSWSFDGHVITIALPPGQTLRLSMSSGLDPTRLAHMGLPAWSGTAMTAELTAEALNGQLATLTAPRTVTLVHAVAQPLTAPAFSSDTALQRDLGATTATLTGTVSVDPLTTQDVDIYATVEDWQDEGPGSSLPTAVIREIHVGRIPAGATSALSLNGLGFDLGDTSAHLVSLRAVASSVFAEYFADDATSDLTATGQPSAWLDALATAAPQAPVIESVIPTYGWTKTPGETATSSAADGNGLRIYMRRPGGNSGAGERLVVRLAQDDSASLIGNDPLVTGAPPVPALIPENFAQTAGSDDTSVEYVLDFDPDYPPDGGRYSVDIVMALPPGTAYRPFVNLAVSIRQLSALSGCEDSEELMTGWYQLAPSATFTATLVVDPSTSLATVAIEGSGPGAAYVVVSDEPVYETDLPYGSWAGFWTRMQVRSNVQLVDLPDPDNPTQAPEPLLPFQQPFPSQVSGVVFAAHRTQARPQALIFVVEIQEMTETTAIRTVHSDQLLLALPAGVTFRPIPTDKPQPGP